MLDVCFRRPSYRVHTCSMVKICDVLKLQDRKVTVLGLLLKKTHAQSYSVVATISNKTLCTVIKWTKLDNFHILNTFK